MGTGNGPEWGWDGMRPGWKQAKSQGRAGIVMGPGWEPSKGRDWTGTVLGGG